MALPVYTYTFIWRTSTHGDFFQRDFQHYPTTGGALKAWNEVERIDIAECCEFSFTRVREE